MRGFLLVAGECEGHRQRADTAAVHVDDQDELGHPVPIGTFAGGKTARGECRGGLKQRVKQLDIRLYHGEQETGNQDERAGHHHDGGRFLHQ